MDGTAGFTRGTIAFTIAVDSAYGATSGYSFVSSTGKVELRQRQQLPDHSGYHWYLS